MAARAPAITAEEPEQLSLFEIGGVDMPSLRRERAAFALAGRAPNTRLAYESDWRDWSAWCASAGRAALPATADTVQLYLVSLAGRGLAVATIRRRGASIAGRHLAAGYASPVDPDAREVMAGIERRQARTRQSAAKAALSLEELRALVRGCGRGVRGARDRALLLLGFASGLRRSELAGLDLADVRLQRLGVVISLRASKTDQTGKGREIGVHNGRRVATCPARALRAWIAERGRWAGPLFCRLSVPMDHVRRDRLSGHAVAAVVKTAAERAGLDPAKYAGHSLRAGCATSAAELGASDSAIMGRTGHKSVGMVRRYVRHGSLFAVDPLAGGL